MKRLLIVVMLVVSCIACHSQECPYKFLGIPIEGTMDEFAKKLEQKGFKKNFYSQAKDGRDFGCYNYYFTGKFFGEDCMIMLSSEDSNSNVITIVSVVYAKGNTLSVYKDLRNALVKQYSDTNRWIFDMQGDIGDLSYYQIRQAISEGQYFLFRILDVKVNRPYISLEISGSHMAIHYCNSDRVAEIVGEREAKKAQDL